MSKIFAGARIVEIVRVPHPDKTESPRLDWFDLSLETDCGFHLASKISIPNDPTIFGEIDIPAYDGRSVEEWLKSL